MANRSRAWRMGRFLAQQVSFWLPTAPAKAGQRKLHMLPMAESGPSLDDPDVHAGAVALLSRLFVIFLVDTDLRARFRKHFHG